MEARPSRAFMSLVSLLFACLNFSAFSLSSASIVGLHPLDEKYFAFEVIKCKDQSKSFTRDRINDNFCDCADGTDEPGTSACPTGKFYCRNAGSAPLFLFSSRVNDHICDCCDGSDEYDGSVNCQNTCVMGGNVVYKSQQFGSAIRDLGHVDEKETKYSTNLEDIIVKFKGLKMVIIAQLVLISCVVAFRLFHRRARTRRRRYH